MKGIMFRDDMLKAIEEGRKPDCVRAYIDACFPNARKIELFARERFEGWDAWGNEILNLNILVQE